MGNRIQKNDIAIMLLHSGNCVREVAVLFLGKLFVKNVARYCAKHAHRPLLLSVVTPCIIYIIRIMLRQFVTSISAHVVTTTASRLTYARFF